MDAFFASVEQMDNPKLRGKPVIVGAAPDQRGVVAAASYEARRFGVRSAMPSCEAGRLCPKGVFVVPRMERYSEVSARIRGILERFSPFVEPLSIDEAFLDVTGSQRLFGPGPELAARLKEAIRSETGLTASAGVAPNKFLAKLASEMEKPDGLVVAPFSWEAIARFLAPMPAGNVWGVGKVTQRVLEQGGLKTIGDLQRVDERVLRGLVGTALARHLKELCWGHDLREIELDIDEKSISREYTFPSDCRDRSEIRGVLLELVDDVGMSLRRAGRYAGTVRIKMRWDDFKTFTRQRRVDPALCDDFGLWSVASDLLEAESLLRPVRLVGFGVSQLRDSAVGQLDLFEAGRCARRERLSKAMDAIRDRHGRSSIRRGSDSRVGPVSGAGRGEGPSVIGSGGV